MKHRSRTVARGNWSVISGASAATLIGALNWDNFRVNNKTTNISVIY